MNAFVFVFMGPAGSGKTTLAKHIAQHFGCPFIEGDELHSEENVRKMSNGIPLTDDDRWQWLADLKRSFVEKAKECLQTLSPDAKRIVTVTCSALKKKYRETLAAVENENIHVKFVFLKTSEESLRQRLACRKGHYMTSSMLKSQLETLEEPQNEADVIIVNSDFPLNTLKTHVIEALNAFI